MHTDVDTFKKRMLNNLFLVVHKDTQCNACKPFNGNVMQKLHRYPCNQICTLELVFSEIQKPSPRAFHTKKHHTITLEDQGSIAKKS